MSDQIISLIQSYPWAAILTLGVGSGLVFFAALWLCERAARPQRDVIPQFKATHIEKA